MMKSDVVDRFSRGTGGDGPIVPEPIPLYREIGDNEAIHQQAGNGYADGAVQGEIVPLVREEPGIDGAQQEIGGGDEWRGQAQDQAQVPGGQAQGQGEAEEANWNPMEWDRPAEELTWERLLGLDGSLVFLEHVFWVISLNTLFIMVRIEKIELFDDSR